jgi:hypothetical protein
MLIYWRVTLNKIHAHRSASLARNWDVYDALLERQSGGALTTGETVYRWSLGCNGRFEATMGTDMIWGCSWCVRWVPVSSW